MKGKGKMRKKNRFMIEVGEAERKKVITRDGNEEMERKDREHRKRETEKEVHCLTVVQWRIYGGGGGGGGLGGLNPPPPLGCQVKI